MTTKIRTLTERTPPLGEKIRETRGNENAAKSFCTLSVPVPMGLSTIQSNLMSGDNSTRASCCALG